MPLQKQNGRQPFMFHYRRLNAFFDLFWSEVSLAPGSLRTCAESYGITAELCGLLPEKRATYRESFALLSENRFAQPFPMGHPLATLDLKRLKALHSEPPKTLIALVRIAWPEIKIALNQGHSLKTVHQRLSEAQIKITYRRLSEYVSRLRSEEKQFGATRKNGSKAHIRRETCDDSNPIGSASASTATDSGETNVSHPLADFRERTAKSKTFDFEPGPPDESKLI